MCEWMQWNVLESIDSQMAWDNMSNENACCTLCCTFMYFCSQNSRQNCRSISTRHVAKYVGVPFSLSKALHFLQCEAQRRHFALNHYIFTQGQFWPPGIVVGCVCLCVCPCVNHEPIRAITHHPFKLGYQIWTKCVKDLGYDPYNLGGDWTWSSSSNLTSKSKSTPFWPCPHNNSSPVHARTTKFGPEEQNTLVKIAIVLGADWASHVKFKLFPKSNLFASLLRLWNICETYENGVCPTSWMAALIYVRPQDRVIDSGTIDVYL